MVLGALLAGTLPMPGVLASDSEATLASAISITAGENHTCALRGDGTAICWGNNQYGQLGDGTIINRLTPVAVSGLGNAISITAGEGHTCALLNDGTAKCWGDNGQGQLGDGTTTDRLTPVAVSELSDAISMTAGSGYTCAVLSDGTAKCWGGGYGSTAVAVSGLSDAIGITAGRGHTCTVLGDGTAKCWGSNYLGQLGDGTTTDRSTPVTVSGLSNAVSIAAGGFHTCALLADGSAKCWGDGGSTPVTRSGLSDAISITAGNGHTCALLADGTAKCWGDNYLGQLGAGTTENSGLVAVSDLSNAVSISAGGSHTCAVLGDGTAKCWGWRGDGELGDGTAAYRHTPVLASGLSNAVSTSAGSEHTCAVLGDGTAKCWGYNWYIQLGVTPRSDRFTPVAVPGLSNAVGIAAGHDYNGVHTCALLGDGTAKCWGNNGHGQLGDGTDTSRYQPTEVAGINDAIEIATGAGYTCAVLIDGTAKCWGRNHHGQLGDGTTTDRFTPVAVSGISNAISITAGSEHACAILDDGTAKCWGQNHGGQLGDGTTTDRFTPVAVSGLTNAISITTSGDNFSGGSTCAVLADGTAKCWGRNQHGQLGDGTTTDRLTAVAVSGLSNAISITAGPSHTCAVLGDGTAKCWGSNGAGGLGDGTTTDRLTPVAVSDLSNAVSITAGGGLGMSAGGGLAYSCAVLGDGTAKCWGSNRHGQLGNGVGGYSSTPVLVQGIGGGAVPDAPTGLSATASGSAIDLSWDAPSSNGGASITSYQLYRGTASGSLSYYDTISASRGTVYSDSDNLMAGTTYYYRVSAVNGVGEGPQSDTASTTTPTSADPGSTNPESKPSAPGGLSPGIQASSSATDTKGPVLSTLATTLTWTPPSEPVDGYRVYLNKEPFNLPATYNGVQVTSPGWQTPLLECETTYRWQVEAYNAAGTGPLAPTPTTDRVYFTTRACESSQAEIPVPVLRAEPGPGQHEITLNWDLPQGIPSSEITGYRISWARWAFGADDQVPHTETVGPTTSFTHSNLRGFNSLNYRISAVTDEGAGPPSNLVSASPLVTRSGTGYFFIHGICSAGDMWTNSNEHGHAVWDPLTNPLTGIGAPFMTPTYGGDGSPNQAPEAMVLALKEKLLHFINNPLLLGDQGSVRTTEGEIIGLDHPLEKVVLIGHSNGGLMARWLFTDPDLKPYIDRVVTIDSPDKGAGGALGEWLNNIRPGGCSDAWSHYAYNYLTSDRQWLEDHMASTVDDARVLRFVFGTCLTATTPSSCKNGNIAVWDTDANMHNAILLAFTYPVSVGGMANAAKATCAQGGINGLGDELLGVGLRTSGGDSGIYHSWGIEYYAEFIAEAAKDGLVGFFAPHGPDSTTYDCSVYRSLPTVAATQIAALVTLTPTAPEMTGSSASVNKPSYFWQVRTQTYEPGFTATASSSENTLNGVQLRVNSDTHPGKVVVINVDPALWSGATPDDVGVWLDDLRVRKALNPADLTSDTSATSPAKYLFVEGAAGPQYLIWVPHFSERVIEISTREEAMRQETATDVNTSAGNMALSSIGMFMAVLLYVARRDRSGNR